MYYVYMDESGGIGKYGLEGSSKYFFIVFLITKDFRMSHVTLRNTEKWMIKKKISHTGGVFHANKELPETRMKMLELSKDKDFIIVACYINKQNVKGITKDPHFLYNNMVCKLLKLCIDRNIFFVGEKIEFIASRRETNKILNCQFENQIRDLMKGVLDINIQLKFPNQEKGLQHVDLFAYSLFHKFEFNDSKLFDMFSKHIKILEEYRGKEI